jgi:prepilin-type N-terminal cleavage/methylation domain-containing protein
MGDRSRVDSAGSGGRDAGFTLMEIMIATAILTLGLVGILALFPVAIDSGRKVMERSTAAAIAKSVAEQIRAGIRNQKRYNYKGATPYAYFIFQHDGVQDPIPSELSLERPDKDYYILLPQFKPGFAGQGATDMERRLNAVKASKEFVYPEDDEPPNGNGDPNLADNDGDDSPDGTSILVKKVYTVGNRLPKPEDTGENVLEDQKDEPYKQYSFAFSIRASMFDANMNLDDKRFEPANELYHVRVMVFRTFGTLRADKVQEEGKGKDPVYEMDFEVAR